MKVKYTGETFSFGLTNGKVYECLGIEDWFLRIVDDTDEDYLYFIDKPCQIDQPEIYGRWEIIEDSPDGLLATAFAQYIK